MNPTISDAADGDNVMSTEAMGGTKNLKVVGREIHNGPMAFMAKDDGVDLRNVSTIADSCLHCFGDRKRNNLRTARTTMNMTADGKHATR